MFAWLVSVSPPVLCMNEKLTCGIGDDPDIADKGPAVKVQLLEACAEILASRGVRGMLADGISGSEELQSMGRSPALRSDGGNPL